MLGGSLRHFPPQGQQQRMSILPKACRWCSPTKYVSRVRVGGVTDSNLIFAVMTLLYSNWYNRPAKVWWVGGPSN